MTAQRLLRLLNLLQDWRTREDLGRLLRCSSKETSRDLQELRALGFTLEFQAGSRGRRSWRIQEPLWTVVQLIDRQAPSE